MKTLFTKVATISLAILLAACTENYRQFLAPDVKIDRKRDVIAVVDASDPQGVLDRISSELAANGFDVRNSRAVKIAAVESKSSPGQTQDGAAIYPRFSIRKYQDA